MFAPSVVAVLRLDFRSQLCVHNLPSAQYGSIPGNGGGHLAMAKFQRRWAPRDETFAPEPLEDPAGLHP